MLTIVSKARFLGGLGMTVRGDVSKARFLGGLGMTVRGGEYVLFEMETYVDDVAGVVELVVSSQYPDHVFVITSGARNLVLAVFLNIQRPPHRHPERSEGPGCLYLTISYILNLIWIASG